MNDYEMMSPEKVAEAYGGDKRRIAQAAKMGVLNPTVAVMAGMFIDRMRGAVAKESQPQSTVAEDVMQPRLQANVQQQAGLDALPVSNDMVPDYAGGGIVAFADGGDVPSYRTGELIDYSPVRMGKAKSPYEDLVVRQAMQRGEDPERALEILYRETGSMKNAERALSPKGARGLMQILPSTASEPGFGAPSIFALAKERGIQVPDMSMQTADTLLQNPELNAEFGTRYRSALERRFGGDPVLAAAAYNAGPGAVTKAGDQVPNIAETQKYVQGISPQRRNFIDRQEAAAKKVQQARREQLASGTLEPQGPMIPRPSVMEGKDKPPTDYQALLASRQRRPVEPGLGSTFDPFLDATTPASEDVSGLLPISKYLSEGKPFTIPNRPKEGAQDQAKPETKTVKEEAVKGESYGDKLERLLSEREGRLSAQREQDKNLALLAAGLGIMGGQSPYAAQNIGAGALKGVEQYGSARKLTRQEEEDILAGRLGQYRYGEESRMRGEDRRLNQGMTLASMEEKRIRDEFGKILGNVLDPRNKQLQELLKRDPDYVDRLAISGRNRILKGYGLDFGEQEPVGSSVAKDYSKWGKLNVGK